MAVQLVKGQNVDLTKENPGLSKITVGLGWDQKAGVSGSDFDLDASAFMLNAEGKCTGDANFIFYNNLKSVCESIVHTGDNLTGEGEGDDEAINVELSKIPADVDKVAFTVTIHDAVSRNQNFGQVANAFIRIVNQDTNEEIAKYDLGEDYSIETSMIFAEIYRKDGQWKFKAIGNGFAGGLNDVIKNYGLS